MAKQKDVIALNRMILELAKSDLLTSREELKERTHKPITTIKRYMHNDLKKFVEIKHVQELVNRGKKSKKEGRGEDEGKGITSIEKYKLKPGLDNLLAIFNLITDETTKEDLIHTNYFENQKPLIINKLKELIKIPDDFERLDIFNVIINSFSAVHQLLILSPQVVKTMQESANKIKQAYLEKLNFPQDLHKSVDEGINYDDVIDLVLGLLYMIAVLETSKNIALKNFNS